MRSISGCGKAVAAFSTIFFLTLGLHAVGQSKADSGTKSDAPAATYIGSDACKACHKNLAQAWATNAHAKALASEGLSDNLKGCEACHGPGSAHISDPANVKPVNPISATPKEVVAACGKCHFEGEPGAETNEKTIQPKYWRRSEHSRGNVSCVGCHSVHVESPKLLKKEAPELCATCHSNIVKKGDYLHSPVAGGACLKCHDPHGTNSRHHLVANLSEVCTTCHSPKAEKFTVAHGGYDVSSAKCVECHSAHSRNKSGKLIKAKQHTPFKSRQCQMCHQSGSLELKKSEKELCTMCHSKNLAEAPADDVHMHAPVAEGMCTRCHSAHASDASSGLWKDKTVAYSCFMCHNKIESTIDSTYSHKPAHDLNCQSCHTPHTSKQKNLLAKDSIELCKGCHEPHLHPLGKTPDGKVVIDPTTNNMLTCASCHTPHGSDFDKLTKKDKNAALCNTCHNTAGDA